MLMFISPRVSSPQATGNAADYLIVRYADGRVQFYFHFMMRSWESYPSLEKFGGASEGVIQCFAGSFRAACTSHGTSHPPSALYMWMCRRLGWGLAFDLQCSCRALPQHWRVCLVS